MLKLPLLASILRSQLRIAEPADFDRTKPFVHAGLVHSRDEPAVIKQKFAADENLEKWVGGVSAQAMSESFITITTGWGLRFRTAAQWRTRSDRKGARAVGHADVL